MSPLAMNVALHYYFSPEDYRAIGDGGPVDSAIAKLVLAGLLREVNDVYEGRPRRCVKTPGLDLYIRAVLAVPFPVEKWVMP